VTVVIEVDIKDRNTVTIYCNLEDVNMDFENKAHIMFTGNMEISKHTNKMIGVIVKALRDLKGKDVILIIKEMG